MNFNSTVINYEPTSESEPKYLDIEDMQDFSYLLSKTHDLFLEVCTRSGISDLSEFDKVEVFCIDEFFEVFLEHSTQPTTISCTIFGKEDPVIHDFCLRYNSKD